MEAGDYQKAIELLRPFVRSHPDRLEPRTLLGDSLYQVGQYIQARVELDRACQKDKCSTFARLYQGLSLARLGKADKAISAWNCFLSQDVDPIAGAVIDQLSRLGAAAPDFESIAAAVDQAIALKAEALTATQGTLPEDSDLLAS